MSIPLAQFFTVKVEDNVMYSVNFYLKTPNSTTETLIYLFIRYQGKRIKKSTRHRIHPKLWDAGNQSCTRQARVILDHNTLHPGIQERLITIQSELYQLRKEISKFFAERSIQGLKPTFDELDAHITGLINPVEENDKPSDKVIEYLRRFIYEAEEGKRKQSNGLNYSGATIHNYINLLNTLHRFEKDTRTTLRWDEFDRAEYSRFMSWQEQQGFSINYRGKHVKDLKSLMRTAFDDDVHGNIAFQKKWFAVPRVKTHKEPLTISEMEALYNLDLKPGSSACIARDFFLIACFTGLRISDIRQIVPDAIIERDGRQFLTIQTRKTGRRVTIPISSRLKTILDRYNNELPTIAEQTINRNIKSIAVQAGFCERRAGNITIHLGRHSFATHLYLSGLSRMDIMTLTGHTTERNLMSYINIKPEETASRLTNHEFFK